MEEFYKTITEWLLPLGYIETYQNHPCSKEREFHFIKEKIRVVCKTEEGDIVIYILILLKELENK